MAFKFTVITVVAAIAAFATAFGNAWTAANTNTTPGVQANEYWQIILAGLIAASAALFHDTTPTSKL